MPLLTYEQVRPWAQAIKQKVVVGEMSLWYRSPRRYPQVQGDPLLTDTEIAKIVNWVDGGALLGNPADLPPPRKFTDLDQWHIGKPDLVLTMAREHVAKAQGPDESFDIDVDLPFDILYRINHEYWINHEPADDRFAGAWTPFESLILQRI
jgi:hypothetical protein